MIFFAEVMYFYLTHRICFGSGKNRVLREADLLCFPTYYAAEVIPTVIIDAMAYGLPVVSTEWRGVPELAAVQRINNLLDQET